MSKLRGIALLAALLLSGSASAQQITPVSLSSTPMTPRPETGVQTALVCFYQGQQVSGMNRICFYNCNGSGAAITIGATQICPLNINR